MSVLTNVERKSRTGKIFLTGVFVAILLGSVSMVYPFLLMLSGSVRSEMDVNNVTILPGYMTDDENLVRKFLETKYNYDPTEMNRYHRSRDYTFADASVPEKANATAVADYTAFANDTSIPDHWHVLGATRFVRRMESRILAEFRARIYDHYDGDLMAVAQDLGTPMVSWRQLEMLPPDWANPRYDYNPSPVYQIYFDLLRERPVADRSQVNLTGEFLDIVIYLDYSATDTKKYNANHAKSIASYDDLRLSRRVPGPDQPQRRKEWLSFALERCHVSFVRAEVPAERFQAYLKDRFRTIKNLRTYWPTNEAPSFDAIELPGDRVWLPAEEARIYRAFLETLEPETLYFVGPEFAWQDAMQAKYMSLDALNKAHGTEISDWTELDLPIADVEADYVRQNAFSLRTNFAIKNFRVVFNEVFIQGRPFFNTLVYVAITLIFALSLQPLAAYALSRFNPPGMWKIIFIFMATMAFPPMVSTIPMFLMIKKLGLLNSFIALVIPVAINGYLIFLLKGFFDSIPKHLYEAAQIEGASELTMFWRITMPLSKPILAVVALNAFRMAWMNFMYPLIVCPDEKMHVLAVWLHQFQREAPTSAIFASILIASIPTLLIFLFTQGTIMKGIAVPAEK